MCVFVVREQARDCSRRNAGADPSGASVRAIPFALPALSSNGLGGGVPTSSRETGQLRLLRRVCVGANGQGCAGQELLMAYDSRESWMDDARIRKRRKRWTPHGAEVRSVRCESAHSRSTAHSEDCAHNES